MAAAFSISPKACSARDIAAMVAMLLCQFHSCLVSISVERGEADYLPRSLEIESV